MIDHSLTNGLSGGITPSKLSDFAIDGLSLPPFTELLNTPEKLACAILTAIFREESDRILSGPSSALAEKLEEQINKKLMPPNKGNTFPGLKVIENSPKSPTITFLFERNGVPLGPVNPGFPPDMKPVPGFNAYI